MRYDLEDVSEEVNITKEILDLNKSNIERGTALKATNYPKNCIN